ncbi:hypothetical protein F0562_031826 [Nyssa sinensis]|uniref:J domain-containing protein n=1 Tax=Nyssa sinensis TaxID=561372 RepID=A0A5J5AY26_9ASTE|nr:hypothetical protein F0562_031826 [Nyssa sinensis]
MRNSNFLSGTPRLQRNGYTVSGWACGSCCCSCRSDMGSRLGKHLRHDRQNLESANFMKVVSKPTMTKREAALILGIRENATPGKVKEAHRRVMVANHPDAGGSHYLASKINEAKDVMLGKTKSGGSAF